MAKNNKYSSINFNHIYEKSLISNNSSTNPSRNLSSHPSHSSGPSYSAASYSAVSSPNKSHGRMLVLTRTTPKPVPILQSVTTNLPQQQQQQQSPLQPPTKSPAQQPTISPVQQQPHPDQSRGEPGSDTISLRPLGRTGTGPLLPSPVLNQEKDKELVSSPVTSPKPNKFVPPHLRPGYVRREEKPVLDATRSRDAGHRYADHYGGHRGGYDVDGRPRSGGGIMTRIISSDTGIIARPRSSGNRPRSSGWFEGSFRLTSSFEKDEL